MAEDAGIGILRSQFLQQLVERMLLGFSAGVGFASLFIQAALIHDTQATVVVVAGMNALDGLGQQGDDVAIATHVVVVRALAVLGLTAGYQVLDAERAVALVAHTVDYQELY